MTTLDQETKHLQEAVKPFTLDEFYSRNTQSQKEIKQEKLIDHKTVKTKYNGKLSV